MNEHMNEQRNRFTYRGTVHELGPVQTFGSGFRKREIVGPSHDDGLHQIVYQPAPIVTPTGAGDGRPTYHEVKGSYHLPTHERARLAWEIAAEAHPEWDFAWAELTRRGWEIERWESGGRRITVHYAGEGRGVWHEVEAGWRRRKPRKSSTRNGKAR